MLEKNIDMALLGHNYLSYLLSFDLLSKNRKVLMLDDERLKYGPLFGRQVCELERAFLKTWGEDSRVSPFINLDRYLSPSPLFFHVDDEMIQLGNSPYENLLELTRKLPLFFTRLDGRVAIECSDDFRDQLNNEFISFCQRVGQNTCRFSSLQSISLETFLNHCPVLVKELFLLFKENVNNIFKSESKYWEYKTFLYSAKGFFQSRMALKSSEIELFHLFHSMLSPFYKLKEDKINEELKGIFEERGGQLKRTHVREWKFYKESPWSIELASFEGIIHPQRVSLLGGIPEQLPLKVFPDNKCYKNVTTRISLDEKTNLSDGVYIMAKNSRIGTNYALIVLEKYGHFCQVEHYVLKKKGQKISFFKGELEKWLREDLRDLIPNIKSFKESGEFEFGHEVFVAEGVGGRIRSGIQMPKRVRIYDTSNPLFKKRLNNVYYFGPYKDSHLGLFSTLVDIKEAQQFL
ncbi:hypothetical protein BIY24_08550 [Halobacteriovorax marinus]|uniref:Uncharacterized protein n=1 Tax=Halobacteriovorax marinus (strain ATCC BAA-682 / DSM 15412 / SJ) TaxID=862908 RepID=E1X1Y7_HALMS|nr:hypothetical protein [Halobacteriovorax marinus]ATH07999.1 hypothetical protein BIY24_08550 [Halobacteriovorax marinus]CBW26647.1 hypothetical protein BMS_1826 [Halobacteriovorax marinus SJ]